MLAVHKLGPAARPPHVRKSACGGEILARNFLACQNMFFQFAILLTRPLVLAIFESLFFRFRLVWSQRFPRMSLVTKPPRIRTAKVNPRGTNGFRGNIDLLFRILFGPSHSSWHPLLWPSSSLNLPCLSSKSSSRPPSLSCTIDIPQVCLVEVVWRNLLTKDHFEQVGMARLVA